MTRPTAILLTFFAMAISACQSALPTQQGQASNVAPSAQAPNVQSSGNLCDNPYVPAVEGATWTSNVHSELGDDTQIDTVTDAGSDAFLVETVVRDLDYVITWSCTPEGLLWLQTDGGMFSAIFQVEGTTSTWETVSYSGVSLPKNIQPGDAWSSFEQLNVTDSTGSRSYDIAIDFHAVGIESVTVPAGTFNALHIDLTMSWTSQYGEVSVPISDWFAAGVGLVKSSAGSSLLELVSYSIP